MDRSFDARACVRRPAGATRGWLIGTALACGLGLGGCVEDAAQAPPPPAAPPADNIARRPDVSPAGATVGIASVGGAPGSLDDSFRRCSPPPPNGATCRLADGGDPNYLVRGYLSAYPEGDNTTAVSYVLDIFDAKKQRTQRVGDEIVVRGQAPDSLVTGQRRRSRRRGGEKRRRSRRGHDQYAGSHCRQCSPRRRSGASCHECQFAARRWPDRRGGDSHPAGTRARSGGAFPEQWGRRDRPALASPPLMR